jgi:predicted MFS family arabinose efflux permease
LLAVAFVAPFVGTVSDILGRKRLIVTACFGIAVPTFLIAVSTSLEAMVALRFLQGFLLPFIFAITVAYIGDEFTGADGIRVAGAYSLGTIFGGFLGRFIAGVAAEIGGWRLAFWVIGGLSVLAASFVAWALPRERNFRPLAGGLRGTLATYRMHLGNPRLLATCAIGFCMLFSMVATFTYVNFYLSAPPFGLGAGALAFVFTVYLLGMVTAPLASGMAVRFGRRAAVGVMLGLAIAGELLTLVQWLPAVIAGLAGTAGGLFVVQTLSLGFIAATVPQAKSTAVGLYVTTYYVGGALGGIVPGLLWTAFGWSGVVASLVVLAIAMLALTLHFWREDAAR